MSLNLSILRKVRCRFLDRRTGKPVPKVVASLSVVLGEGNREARLPVSTLCSDGTGYVSYDLKPLIDMGLTGASGLSLSAPSYGLRNFDLLNALFVSRHADETMDVERPIDDEDEGGESPITENHEIFRGEMTTNFAGPRGLCIVFPVYIEEPKATEDCDEECNALGLPAIQSPDACDYKVSPYSFVSPTKINIGGDCCETIVPATLPLQEHRFYQVVVRREIDDNGDYSRLEAGKSLSLSDAVNITEQLQAPSPKIRMGEVLEYRQRWFSLGHSLGEIKYSLPLAPGEATQIAVIEWARQDLASRTDEVRGAEFMDHDLRRDRSIEETVDTALREQQGGWSFMAGHASAAEYDTKAYGDYKADHAFGGSVSNTWGNRDVEGESLQDLHDRVRQATSYVRSLKSTVVLQASQNEQNFLQTRRVANHNHCHALTVQYYEVLRHFLLKSEFVRRRKAILIPFAPFAFTWQLALRFRSILERALLDPALAKCFDALVRLNVVPGVYDSDTPPPPVNKPAAKVRKTKTVEVKGTLGEGVGSGIMLESGDAFSFNASGEITMGRGFEGAGAWSRGPNGNPDPGDQRFLAPGMRQYSLIYKIGQTGPWRQGGSYTSANAYASGELVFGVNDEKGFFEDNYGFDHDKWTVTVDYPAVETESTPAAPAETVEETPTAFSKTDDQLCSAKLITHLAANQGFYDRVVWTQMDVSELRLYVERALRNISDVLNGINDQPIAISGNQVAFFYDGPLEGWDDDARTEPLEPVEDIVTLPTRGLFAEAQMGHCNSCEKRDVTRMWDWTEMTTETPPAITGIEPGPQGTIPSLTPTPLPSNVIQITQPQTAPDPTGLAKAFEVLKTPNIFRDMSGLEQVSELLGKLASGLINDPEAVKKAAADAKAKVDDAKKPDAGKTGTDPATPTKNRTEPNEKDAAKQVDKLKVLEDAKDKNLISDEQASDSAMGILGGEVIQAAAIDRNISNPMGIDVSHHNGNINWTKVVNSGVYFAFIKASDGQTTDNKFQINWSAARAAGLPCGAYHFWLPQVTGRKQAETLIRQVGFLQPGDLPPVLDVEDGPHANFTGKSVSDLEDNIQEFIDTVQAEFGIAPMIYTYPGFWQGKLNNSNKFSSYLLWIANYSPKDDPTLPGGWPIWDFWQITDSGTVDGVAGGVDMNMFNGDIQTLWQLARKNPRTIEI